MSSIENLKMEKWNMRAMIGVLASFLIYHIIKLLSDNPNEIKIGY